jgi:hypothetical protein
MWLKRLVIGRRGPSVAGDVWRQLTDACRTLAMLVSGVENTEFTYALYTVCRTLPHAHAVVAVKLGAEW